MARKARTQTVIPDYPHHVVLRGNNRRRLCSRVSDYLRLIDCVARAVEKHPDCKVHGLVVLPNHLHSLITPPSAAELSSLIKSAAQPYAQYRNRKHNGSGKLFEERYFAKPMESDAHYAATHAYLDLNPKRAGIRAELGDYRWSTYHLMATDGRDDWAIPFEDLWTPSPWYLNLSADPGQRRARYTAFVRDCLRLDARPEHASEIDALERNGETAEPRIRRPDNTSAR